MISWVFPGQGSQKKGMGDVLFDEFPDITQQADIILGYSIKTLCLDDPQQQLNQTLYTQPALYVVNALHYFKKLAQNEKQPDFVAGHSLGEYNALLAAGAFDFATGLRLVQRRAQLMSEAKEGGMAALINLSLDELNALLRDQQIDKIDIANYNSPQQIVISGPKADLQQIAVFCEAREGVRCAILPVSAAFHSRYMRPAQQAFANDVQGMTWQPLKIPVIANVTAQPYSIDTVSTLLAEQITSEVNWVDSIRYLLNQGVSEFIEVGPGNVLTKLVNKIREATPTTTSASSSTPSPSSTDPTQKITPATLGSASFRQAHGIKYAYVTGAMYKGIASTQLVRKIAQAGLLGYLGAGGLALNKIEAAIQELQRTLSKEQVFGVNFLHNPVNPQQEQDLVDLLFKYNVKRIDAAAFMQITPALARYRLKGLQRGVDGQVIVPNRLMAKISHPEVAKAFLSPAPERVVQKLREAGQISAQEAELARQIPMADDLCVESDSGGHTDMGIMTALLPTIQRQRNATVAEQGYAMPIHVGAAGGIGTPEAAASAFILGADFILTGSINQCTPEAGTSDVVKDMLQSVNVQDTDYAPAGDMFELGAKVQVMRKGVFFPARANKLYELYRNHNALEDIDAKTRQQIQDKYFRRSFDEVYAETKAYYLRTRPEEITKAERNPKHKMALIFKWYFIHSNRLALQGNQTEKVNYQVHCGPAMGAFNQWVKNTELEAWQQRHVDVIAEKLMQETAALLNTRLQQWLTA